MGAKEDHEYWSDATQRLGLDDEDAEKFVSDAMTRHGHKRVTSWEDNPDNGGGGNDGDRDTFGKRKKPESGGNGGGGDRRGGGQYDRR